jgi:hypothetical protein
MGKLPFAAGLFWKTFFVVAALVVLTWWLVVRFSTYEMTPADYGGTTISTILFTYLIHLWMLPGEQLNPGDEEETDGSAH